MNKVYIELFGIQKKLVAKKGEYNKFGNYPYRTAEGILAEVKPLLKDCVVIVNEEIELIGDRYYVVSTATITDGEYSVSAKSQAREDLELKGMTSGQLSGATSSYAKKYALCNLFAIDGTEKDLDGIEDTEEETKPKTATKPPKSVSKSVLVKKMIKDTPITENDVKLVVSTLYKKKGVDELTESEFKTLLIRLENKINKLKEEKKEELNVTPYENDLPFEESQEEETSYDDINFENPF